MLSVPNHQRAYMSRTIDPPLPSDRVQEIFCDMMENVAIAFNGKWPEYTKTNGVNFWRIKYCLSRLQTYPFELRMLWRTVYLLFLHFEERRDPKLSLLVSEVLYFVAYESYYARYMFSPLSIERYLSVLDSSVGKECSNNIVLRLMKRPYSIPAYVARKEMNIVWNSVKMDSEKLLPLLLRQGVVYLPPSTHVDGWNYCAEVLKSICLLEKVERDFVPEELSAVLDPGIPGVRQRIFTVFRAMDVVQHKFWSQKVKTRSLEGGVIKNYHERHRKVFDTIPEPIVTVQEVRRILTEILGVEQYDATGIFCNRFQMIMPESDTSITPRSLKHLSRYQVREVMRVNGMYPYGVYSLQVPKMVRNYILLKDPDDD